MHEVISQVRSDRLTPQVALVCYGSREERGRIGFVSRHPIVVSPKGVPRIEAGEPLSSKELREIIESLALRALAWIDPRILAASHAATVWWTAPGIRHLWWKPVDEKGSNYDELPTRAHAVPLPGLVFRAEGDALAVFAVKGRDRPTPETALFHAPFPNVYDLGKVCMGNARLSGVDWKAAEEAFFASVFTHDVGNIRRVRGFRCAYLALDALAADPTLKAFPEAWLRPAHKDLAWFIAEGGAP